jgi:hypothetical protein
MLTSGLKIQFMVIVLDLDVLQAHMSVPIYQFTTHCNNTDNDENK